MRERAIQEQDDRDIKIAEMNKSRLMSRANSIKKETDFEKSLTNKLERLGMDQIHRSGTVNELKSKVDLSEYEKSFESSKKSNL